ncbi:MAG: ParB N-terminal domain-containing protein [Clostridia bacterium]|nr:ParB N-terminal domain-containing protein [Clostridia bacterium]
MEGNLANVKNIEREELADHERDSFVDFCDVEQIETDVRYQRALSETKVRAIMKDFDLRAIGMIYVSMREDGSLWVLDGQHRLEAAKRMGIKKVQCRVYIGLSREEEARLFYYFNANRGPVSALQRFKAKLVAGDGEARRILAIAKRHGFVIEYQYSRGGSGMPRCIAAVGALEQIYREDGERMLDRVLDVINRAWDGDPESLKGQIFLGVRMFLKRFPKADTAWLIKRLRKTSVSELNRQAQSYAQVLGGHASVGAARAIYAAYNYRLTKNRLPEWD